MSYNAAVEEFIAKQPIYDRRRRFLQGALRAVIGMACKIEVRGEHHIPPSGGTILMINHISAIDPPLVTAVAPRFPVTMAKVETLNSLIPRLAVWLWGNFVVKRGEVDRVALGISVELIKRGQMLVMAPEGTRNKDGLKQPKDGIAYVAHKANAVIVPTAVLGVVNWKQNLLAMKRTRALVVFGKPFRFKTTPDKPLSKDMRGAMMQEAMYQLALTMPDDYAEFRGEYRNLSCATTHHLAFVSPDDALYTNN
jgi:1-acyl-sn-glycerol-3-phosphate acyltransferase